MPIKHDEIIEEIERHIRKFGGKQSEWCVGTAKDARAPFFRRHLTADLGDGMIYREAFSTTAADEVIDHLVHACGLKLAPEAQPPSTAHQAEGSSALPDTLEPGKIVFVYRQTRDSGLGVRDSKEKGAAHAACQDDQPLFPKLAA
jgi:hypothetical protein